VTFKLLTAGTGTGISKCQELRSNAKSSPDSSDCAPQKFELGILLQLPEASELPIRMEEQNVRE